MVEADDDKSMEDVIAEILPKQKNIDPKKNSNFNPWWAMFGALSIYTPIAIERVFPTASCIVPALIGLSFTCIPLFFKIAMKEIESGDNDSMLFSYINDFDSHTKGALSWLQGAFGAAIGATTQNAFYPINTTLGWFGHVALASYIFFRAARTNLNREN